MAATNGIKRFEGKGNNRTYSSEVQAAIVMCGPMSLLLPHIVERVEKAVNQKEMLAIDFMGGALPGQKTGIYVEASPLTHVNKKTPPMLFIDGEFDRPKTRYKEFWTKWINTIFHVNSFDAKAPHPFWGMKEWFVPTLDAVDNFLKKHFLIKG